MNPTVGRVVHVTNAKGEKNAAIITKVWTNTCVDLAIFDSRPNQDNPELVFNLCGKSSCIQGDQVDQWNWPVIER